MGLFGAALATGFSPAVSMCVMSLHVWRKKNGFAFCRVKEVAKSGLLFCKLGISAFVNEFATGVVLTVFNLLILSISGNTGVAAYGVIANIALVGTAVYTGLSQGTQPLVSQYYGKRDHHSTRKLYGFAISTALLLGAVMIGIAWGFTEPLVSVFNGEGNEALPDHGGRGPAAVFHWIPVCGHQYRFGGVSGGCGTGYAILFHCHVQRRGGNSVFRFPPFRSVWHAGHLAGISGGRRGYLPVDSGFHVAEPQGKNKRSGITIKCHLKKATSLKKPDFHFLDS